MITRKLAHGPKSYFDDDCSIGAFYQWGLKFAEKDCSVPKVKRNCKKWFQKAIVKSKIANVIVNGLLKRIAMQKMIEKNDWKK